MPRLGQLLCLALATGLLSLVQCLPSSPVQDAVAAKASPLAHTKNGTYQGTYVSEYDQDFFLGVPYAQPPVGDLRFRNPQSLNTTFSGNMAVAQYSSECYGYTSDQWGYAQSEDCLYLNVVRPSGTKAGAKLPVGFWIHGGGFVAGGGVDKRYNLSFIVQNSVEIGTPFIGVSINYRLSAWGFLASGQVAGAGYLNMGLKDQRLALHWVQENIAAFGGDPKQVTIWGESAGAESIGYHLTAYNGRNDNLFRAAIMESGNPVQSSPSWTADHYDAQYQTLLESVNCQDAVDTLACLRTIPTDAMNAAINTSALIGWPQPIDGDFIARYGSQQFADGSFVKVPIIDGTNTDEGTSFGPYGINSSAQFLADLENGTILPNLNLSANIAQSILDAYPDDPCQGIPETLNCTRLGEPYGYEYRRTSAYAGDAIFTAARRLTCQTYAAAGIDAYCYRYNGWDNGLTEYTGVGHFQEVALVFDNVNGVGYDVGPDPFANTPQSLKDLAKLMSNSWASFIATGDPNTWRETHTSIPLWPVYNTASPEVIVWDNNVTTYTEPDTYRAEGIDTLNSLNIAFQR